MYFYVYFIICYQEKSKLLKFDTTLNSFFVIFLTLQTTMSFISTHLRPPSVFPGLIKHSKSNPKLTCLFTKMNDVDTTLRPFCGKTF